MLGSDPVMIQVGDRFKDGVRFKVAEIYLKLSLRIVLLQLQLAYPQECFQTVFTTAIFFFFELILDMWKIVLCVAMLVVVPSAS